MKVAPIDIAHKNFTRKMMGIDPDEVSNFLRQVAEEMETLMRERNNLREQMREKELAILEYRERDELLKSTITTATKMSDKIQQDAERESRLIISDSKQQAEMIVRDARDSLKRMFQEISDLKKIRMQYENNLRALVQSHLTMLDQGQKILPDPQLEISRYVAQNQSSSHSASSQQQSSTPDFDAIKSSVTEAVHRTVRPMDL
jgi:cell division initiation protein